MLTKIIAIIAALLITTTPVLAKQRVAISDRCKALGVQCPQAQVLEIGKKLGELYYETHGRNLSKLLEALIYTTPQICL
jgi:competence protein ComGC